MRLVFLVVAAIVAHGQGARDPSAVLEQARARLQAAARGLERYVCLETVDRAYYLASVGGAPPRLEFADRVRLEVTVSRGRELHSWPGATRFDSRDVDELIRDGPVSTGAFGAYLASVFDRPGVVFRYRGERSLDGRTAFEYAYSVPREASGFEIKVAAEWRAAAYEGEFAIDPQSLELLRLTVHASQPPADAVFRDATATLDFERARIGDGDVLLPRRSRLEIALRSGGETRNDIAFSNCREYQAESAIVFDAPAGTETSVAPRAGRGRLALPLGLPVSLALDAPIDSALAAAGDPVTAKVLKPVGRGGSGGELIPAGAIVRGRIRRVERHLLPEPYILVAFSFNRVEARGAISPFVARREPDAALVRALGVNLAMRDTGIWFWGVGTFLFPTHKGRVAIPAGSESRWFTLATGGR